MEENINVGQWSDREWLAFLLIAAANADGNQEVREMRFARVGLGGEVVDAMLEIYNSLDTAKRGTILSETLPSRLPTLKSREKLQNLLKKIVLADGEYGPEEQAMVKRISGWLRQG